MRENFLPRKIRLLALLLLFSITASTLQAFQSKKTHLANPPISVETALKDIDYARKNHISIDSSLEQNLHRSINFNRNRYYQPKYGRFTSKDPLGFNADINLYRYANNNPVIFTDPEGFISLDAFGNQALIRRGEEFGSGAGYYPSVTASSIIAAVTAKANAIFNNSKNGIKEIESALISLMRNANRKLASIENSAKNAKDYVVNKCYNTIQTNSIPGREITNYDNSFLVNNPPSTESIGRGPLPGYQSNGVREGQNTIYPGTPVDKETISNYTSILSPKAEDFIHFSKPNSNQENEWVRRVKSLSNDKAEWRRWLTEQYKKARKEERTQDANKIKKAQKALGFRPTHRYK